jgi:drug/metabolite transporter (DMT)-like permease
MIGELWHGKPVSYNNFITWKYNSIFNTMRRKADLTPLIVSIFWGSAFVAQRIAGQMGSVYLFNGACCLLAAVVVLPFAIKANRASNPTYTISRDHNHCMFVAGFVLFLGSALQQSGVVYTTAGNAGFITSLYVAQVPIVLFRFSCEKTHWISIIAAMLAGVGAFFLSTGGTFEVRAGDLLELVSALLWTLHVLILGKYASKFVAVLLSQFKEWNLRSKIDSTHLMEGR